MRQLKITKQVTNREDPSLDKYLTEISKEELISMEEEVDLARRIKEGDNEALKRLVSANLRFVVSVAEQRLQKHVEYFTQGLVRLSPKLLQASPRRFAAVLSWAYNCGLGNYRISVS